MNRFIRNAIALVAGLGFLLLLAVIWILTAPQKQQREAQIALFSPLRIDMPKTEVLELLGAIGEGKRERFLRDNTHEVLVFFFPPNRDADREIPCGPNYLDAAIGLDKAGDVLWYTVLRGEDYVVSRGG